MTIDRMSISFSLAMILLGIALIVFRKRLGRLDGQLGSNFLDPLTDRGRLLAAAQRRRYLEEFPTDVGLWIGLVSIALGVVSLLRIVPYPLAYTGFFLTFSVALTAVYLRPLRTGARRAALLVPRNPFGGAPVTWFVGATVASALPLACWAYPETRFPAILVTCANLVLIVCAWLTANMHAIIVGEDPEAERMVDERLRRVRVRSALSGTFVSSFTFCSFVHFKYQHGHGELLANWIAWTLFTWFVVVLNIELRRGKPKNAI